MYLYHRIEELVAANTDSRRAIGSFVLSEAEHLSDFTIADIAQATFTSKASCTRFAQSLGYDGWRPFIKDFIAEQLYQEKHPAFVDANFPFDAEANEEQVIEAIADLTADAVSDTARLINRGLLARAAKLLADARRVRVFALSPNSYMGGLFCRKLLSIGIDAMEAVPSELGVIARSLGELDCAVIISYSGNNPESDPMRQVPILLANKVPIVAIAGDGNNYLRKCANATLTISSRESLYSKIGTLASEASVNYLLDVLFGCVFARDYERNLEFKLIGGRQLESERSQA
ncbi:MurR/RpiR family transcriptional regulator [Paratractidigestivibacter sp.]|uniref:MurR/RpiR family transcriptional regulator n=1 Tax=Paratractidigestivibacter sp. TaxID=2847316 RepID=UPI002ABD2B40|nr:MurR/RpiR family transcriptional regulator [Paratractidigestivibacter sp.]